MKYTLMNLSLISLMFILTSCGIRQDFEKADILPLIQQEPEASIVGMSVEFPAKVTFYTDREMSEEEKHLMVECFLAAVVIPEKDLWVNLVMQEPDRIAPYTLGITELGRIMLEQDYILKKAAATATHPDFESGQMFWNKKIYMGLDTQMEEKNWIYPKRTVIVDNATEMFIKNAELDVKNEIMFPNSEALNQVYSETIIPEVKKYVLYSAEFRPIRQAYRAVICGIWFKNKFLNTIYGYCINTNKTGSLEIPDRDMKYKVYERYVYKHENYFYNSSYRGQNRNWGGVVFEKPSQWVEVEKDDTSRLRGYNRFKVAVLPSNIPSSRSSEDTVGAIKIGKVGGIDLNAKIQVEEMRFDVSEETRKEWEESQSISYVLE